MLTLSNLRKTFAPGTVNEKVALDGVNLHLNPGDFVTILGSNGAGKSTLLKAISGIMVPTEGSIKVHGSIAALLELTAGFDKDLTVRENTFLRGAMLGYTRKFMQEKYDEIIRFAELEAFQDRPFKQLSSGMRSRLAFSIACLVNPDVIILDEVLSVGDGAFRKKSGSKMQEILSSGVTGILVSHSVSQVREMCNKILWLDHGRQIAFGEDVTTLCNAYEEFLITKKVPETHEQILEASEAWNARQEVIRRQKKENYAERLEQLVAECGAGTAVQAAVDILYRNRAELLNRELCLGEELIPEK